MLITMEHASKLVDIKHENGDFEIKHEEVSFELIEENDWKDDSEEENLTNYEVKVDSEEFDENEICQIREIKYIQVAEETSCAWNEPAANEPDPLALFPDRQNCMKSECTGEEETINTTAESASTSTVHDGVRKNKSTDFKKHLTIHAGEKSLKCIEFGSNSDLLRRLKVYTGIKSYTCEDCNFETFKNNAMISHLKIHSARKNFKCAECGRAFSRKYHLKRHLQIHT